MGNRVSWTVLNLKLDTFRAGGVLLGSLRVGVLLTFDGMPEFTHENGARYNFIMVMKDRFDI